MRDRFLASVHAAVLGAWLGAAAITAFAVAPAAFEALPTRAAAGTFVGGILRAVYGGALVAAGIGIAVPALRGGKWTRVRTSMGVVLALTATASIAIAARIASMRDALGPIDALPADDPGRRAFGALHGVSILVLFAGMIAALAAIALEAAAGYATSASSSSGSGNRQE